MLLDSVLVKKLLKIIVILMLHRYQHMIYTIMQVIKVQICRYPELYTVYAIDT